MKLPVAILLATLGLPALAAAQSIGEPIPGRGPAKAKPAAAPPASQQATRPCPEYGPGFVRIEGSTSCVRIGGGVRAEFGKSSRNGFGSSADAMLYGEARSPTPVGEMRAVISGRVQRDNNLNNGSWQRW
ncbi:hypothetical protein DK26_08410 [Bosea sp. WAO]|uniref:hypothetical protein n=1 Tax=Bosea sp. WAO TaxID=406341 RepID=UPI000747CB42|nr:hypothetical protein [Bosea sp. WAO]KUL96035.1 hypothetical protein DK26_08410 [Bosea sp. WAO]